MKYSARLRTLAAALTRARRRGDPIAGRPPVLTSGEKRYRLMFLILKARGLGREPTSAEVNAALPDLPRWLRENRRQRSSEESGPTD